MFAGRDGSYGTSMPAFKALDAASDVILAYRHNGRLLTPDHVRALCLESLSPSHYEDSCQCALEE